MSKGALSGSAERDNGRSNKGGEYSNQAMAKATRMRAANRNRKKEVGSIVKLATEAESLFELLHKLIAFELEWLGCSQI